jgi:PadR family transcriptional regulator, regulatory protein AphA
MRALNRDHSTGETVNSRPHNTGLLSPEFVLLGFLAEQPMHGYELHQRIESELGHIWHISQSQVYNILKRLEQQGYISGTVQAQTKLPNRFLFELTSSGMERFETWLDTPTVCSVRAIRVEFITRLFFAGQRDHSKAGALIDSQVNKIRIGLERLNRMLSELPPEQVFNRLGLELRITQLSSIREWLESCHRVIDRQNDLLSQDQG